MEPKLKYKALYDGESVTVLGVIGVSRIAVGRTDLAAIAAKALSETYGAPADRYEVEIIDESPKRPSKRGRAR